MSKERRIGRRPTVIALALVLIAVAIGALAIMGGAAEPKPTLAIAGTSLSFKDNIYMNFYVSAENADELKLLIWEAPQSEYKIGTEQYRLTNSVASGSYKRFVFDKFAARQMTKEVYACAYTNVGGVDYYSDPFKFSMHTYAYGIINGGSAYSESMKALCREMLDYGAAAQVHFDGATARLANDNWLQITVSGGLLSDGTKKGLYLQGDTINVTAPATDERGIPFSHWQNSAGELLSRELSAALTVGDKSDTYTPVYDSFNGYTLVYPAGATDAMTIAAGNLYQQLTNAEATRYLSVSTADQPILTMSESDAVPQGKYIRLCEAEEFNALYGISLSMNDYCIHKISSDAVAISAGGTYALDAAIETFANEFLTNGSASAIEGITYIYTASPAAPNGRADEILSVYNDPNGRMMSISHRGDYQNHPENSLSALSACIDAGVDIVEIGLQRTSDGRYVLMYDTTVNRTTGGTGTVSAMTLDQIKALKLRTGRGGSDAAVTNETVPTLEEALALCKGKIMLTLAFDPANTDSTAFSTFFNETYAKLDSYGMAKYTQYKWGATTAQIETVASLLGGIASGNDKPLFMPVYSGVNCDDIVAQLDTVKAYARMAELSGVQYQSSVDSMRRANEKAASLGIRNIYSAIASIDNSEIWSDLYSMSFAGIKTNHAIDLARYVQSVGQPQRASSVIRMSDYIDQSGIHMKRGGEYSDVYIGQVVDSVSPGDAIRLPQIAFTGHETQVVFSAKINAAGTVKVYADSAVESGLLATVTLVPGNTNDFELISARLTRTVSGDHEIVVTFEGEHDYMAEFDLISFREGGQTAKNILNPYYECDINAQVLPTTVDMPTEGGSTVPVDVIWSSSAPYAAGKHTVHGKTSDGDDVIMTLVVNDIVEISTVDKWNSVAANVNNGTDYSGMKLVLTADLDFSGKSFTVMGTDANRFKGEFDGNGKTISNVTYSGATAGVFGYTEYANIYDLNVADCSFTATGARAGGFVAAAFSTKIDRCSVKNTNIVATTVTGTGARGGFVGYLDRASDDTDSYITNCVTDHVTLEAARDSGGFIGHIVIGSVYNCRVYELNLITTGNSNGGFVGDVYDGDFYDCYVQFSNFTHGQLKSQGGSINHIGAFVGYSNKLTNANLDDDYRESVYVNCTWDGTRTSLPGIGTYANGADVGYYGYMGPVVTNIPEGLPSTLPNDNEYSSFLPKNDHVLSGAQLITDFDTDIPSIKSHSTKGDWKVEATDGAYSGKALYMYAKVGAAEGAGESYGMSNNVRVDCPPEIADAKLAGGLDVTGYSGIMMYIDARGMVGTLDNSTDAGYFTMAVPFDLAKTPDGSGKKELRGYNARAYYQDADGDWIVTDMQKDNHRYKLPTGYKGWVYIPFQYYVVASDKTVDFATYLAQGNKYLTNFRVYPDKAEMSDEKFTSLVIDNMYLVASTIEYNKTTVTPAAAIEADQLKVYGRYLELENEAISCDFTASGIEFAAYCSGDVTVNLTVQKPNNGSNTLSSDSGYFTVWVDGVRQDRVFRFDSKNGDKVTGTMNLTVATGLGEGYHTIKLLKQNNPRNNIAQINSISLYGNLIDRPANKDALIEFIGDSYTAAYGNLCVADTDNGGGPDYEDGTSSYGYLTAQKLGADWSIVARPGIGVAYGTDAEQYQMSQIYHLNCFWRSNTTEYQVGRIPNLVVMYLGTNDNGHITDDATQNNFDTKYRQLVDEVIENYGPNTRILMLDNTALGSRTRGVIQGIGRDYDNVTVLAFQQYHSGYGSHANLAECEKQAVTLSNEIRRLYPELFGNSYSDDEQRQVNLVDGSFKDGTTIGYYQRGSMIDAVAPEKNAAGEDFYCWMDQDGNAIDFPYLVTGSEPEIITFTAIYGQPKFAYETVNSGTAVRITGIGEVPNTALIIPDTIDGLPVTEIAASAFAGGTKYTSVSLPGSLTTIGASAFEGCTKLSRIAFRSTETKWNEIRQTFGANWDYNMGSAVGGTNIVFTDNSDSLKSGVLNVKWNFGYVGSSTNKNNTNKICVDGSYYSYSDVITIPRKGTKVVFVDDNTNSNGDANYASAAAYVFSSWKKSGNEWVIDLDYVNYPGSGTTNSEVCTYANGVCTYTYVTSRDNENIRLCFRSGQLSSFTPGAWPTVSYIESESVGTYAQTDAGVDEWVNKTKDDSYYSQLNGITLNAIGDSYFAGNGLDTDLVWPSLLSSKYGMTFSNNGANGSAICSYDSDRNPMVNRYQSMPDNDPDIVLIEGGRNDYNVNAPIGSNSDTDPSKSFKGGVNYLIDKIAEKYPNALIICVTNWKVTTTNSAGIVCTDYAVAMREVCAAKGVPCFNAADTALSGVNMDDANFRAAYCMNANDVSHLNGAGHRLVLPAFEKFIADEYAKFLGK